MKKKRVYLAGKLRSDAVGYIKNFHRMVRLALEVHKLGYSVFVPALDFLLGMVAGNWEFPDYFSNSQPWLEVSDAVLLVPGWETSEGTKEEIALAKGLGIPVFTSLQGLKEGLPTS